MFKVSERKYIKMVQMSFDFNPVVFEITSCVVMKSFQFQQVYNLNQPRVVEVKV